MFTQSLVLLSSISLAACGTIVFDGRVPATAAVADFDSKTGIFDPEFTKGQNVTFSSLVRLDQGDASLFDTAAKAQPIEVTINDDSIFAPGGSNPQTAVRRAELMPNPANTNANTTSSGVKTLHFSVKPSADRPLNISHEYLMVFMERADFGANLIAFKTGTLIGSDGSSKNDLLLLGNSAKGVKTLFSTPFAEGEFTNFAIKMDFKANTVQVFSSTGSDPLVQQTDALANDLSGNGALHFGLNKNPINPGADSLRSGIQEAGILEGVVYGGIFVEDSADGSITLS
ncbi:glycoside hydrolase family 131 protein [Periconia macrospinosa]|uniref:Glycoside hydrolase family 131 protein n=1 Tax=Periconia macrospinosa TaxID=97972 RepID=A0A2V1EAN4_9PLEO|nr:glycoside hydrolase family 131 protein [Periconia macrospinosa]